MRIIAIVFLLLSVCGLTRAQTNDADLGDLYDAVQQFAQENLDPAVLHALQGVDQDQVVDFFNHYQEYLRGDYVLDLGQLKGTANNILPLLDAHEETQPYAAWLRARLDELDAADELSSETPPPKQEPGKPLARRPNPTFAAVREIWIKERVKPRPCAEKRRGGGCSKIKNCFRR